MMVNTTSETCPTPGRDPDLFLASLGGQASEDWGLAFADAIGNNVDNNQLQGKIDEAGIFGLTDFASYDSTLNTPTMETQELVWAPLDNTLNQSIGDIWNLGGGSPLPSELHAVPMHLVEGGVKEDEGYCPSPDSAPMLSSTTVLSPAAQPGPSPTVVKREVSRERDDLLNWIVNDTIIPTSDMPGEVKEEVVPFQYNIPTTVDNTSVLFSDYDRPREASNIGPERPAKRKGRGRPAIPLGRAITPRVARRKIASGEDSDTVYLTSDGNLTETEAEKMRYRRMRDLNNEASKRCREKRKTKFEVLEMEREELFTRNTELRARLTSLESNVRKLKNFYLEHMAAGKELPDPSTMWSMLNMNPNDF